MSDDRIISADAAPGEVYDRALRPQTLSEFVGQSQAKGNLKVFIDAARGRAEALDHVLLFGPPGLGKTTLAQIVSRELGVGFRATSGPILAKAGDLAAILTNLEPRDVLFIDEIHRLSPQVQRNQGFQSLQRSQWPGTKLVEVYTEELCCELFDLIQARVVI